MRRLALFLLVFLLASASPRPASAQSQDDGWKVTIYPIFVWLPLGISMDVTLPPDDGGPGSGSGAGDLGGKIVDGRFDGAFMGGINVSKGPFRVDFDGLWAAVGGDRVERPALTVDTDLFYLHASGGVRVFDDVYVTGGVRRVALKYDIKLGDRQFERKPGIWDPLVGVGWHRVREKVEYHATFEGGGFGAGAEVDLGGHARIDWKPVSHFGVTAGYSFLYLKFDDERERRVFSVEQTLHGPLFGIGLYF